MQKDRPRSAAAFLTLLLALFPLSACVETGARVFEGAGCIRCHSFKGKGGSMGPDLTAVTNRRSDRWIRRQIRHPKKNDPGSRMPSFEYLSEFEVRSLVRYLKD